MSTDNIPSAQQLRKAADLAEKIATLKIELDLILKTFNCNAGTAPIFSARKKRGMSAAGKAKIAAAQKTRWAKVTAAKGVTHDATKVSANFGKKRKLSAAVKAKMSAAKKAYWANKKAGENKPL